MTSIARTEERWSHNSVAYNEPFMLAALIVVFREIFEAGLIVGIVMAVTRGVPLRGWWIGGGVAGGAAAACAVAVFAGAWSATFGGAGQEYFNATILGVAVVMLTWHTVWMARYGRQHASELHSVGEAVARGTKSLAGLAVVVGVAVLREGIEVVLFLYGIAASEGGPSASILGGGVAGLALGALVCALTYRGLLTVPSRYLFRVTNVMIALLAAGMAAQATAFLEQANALNALDQIVWDTSWILTEKSLVGRALHTLIGYTDQPTAMQLVIYVATLATIFVLMRLFAPTQRRKALPTTP
jgi:high-affinity iron transporter